MKGIQHVEVSNRDAKYKFDLHRNITIVRGNSGTGKTTLFDMITDYTRLKKSSGVNISCEKECVSLIDTDWQHQLQNISDSIVFIDEGSEYLRSKKFAETIKNTDNYYVIFNRESLHELPYSVEEIYEIHPSGKYYSFKKMYQSNKKDIYYKDHIDEKSKIDILLTEDSKSGFQFYENYFKDTETKCEPSYSNADIFKRLKEHKDRKILVIADGAAFGSEIDRVLKLQSSISFKICLPESFEWLILKSGLIKTDDIKQMLDNPAEYIESSEFFSWENFFEEYLVRNTVNTPFQYSKKKINPVYLGANAKKIISEIYTKK